MRRALPGTSVYPLLALKDIVVFPHTIIPLLIENEKTAAVVNASYDAREDVLVCCRKNTHASGPDAEDVYGVGVRAHILQRIELPKGSLKVFIEGKSRQVITGTFKQEGRIMVQCEEMSDVVHEDRRTEALRRLLVDAFQSTASP
jgi:ATP-dependent Lon protease